MKKYSSSTLVRDIEVELPRLYILKKSPKNSFFLFLLDHWLSIITYLCIKLDDKVFFFVFYHSKRSVTVTVFGNGLEF